MKVTQGKYLYESILYPAVKITAHDSQLIVFQKDGLTTSYSFRGELFDEVELRTVDQTRNAFKELFGDDLSKLEVSWK